MRLVKGLLDRCVQVVELMATTPGPHGLSAIAAALDLPKSATHRLLRELCDLGWVEQSDDEGPYRLTLRFGLLGTRIVQATGLAEIAQPLLDRLAAETRELVRMTLAVEDGLVWFANAQGALPGLIYQPATDGPVVPHATANGKALLAYLPEARALDLARRGGLGQPGPTPRTIATEAALLADLAATRERGYALANEEAEPGVTAVAVCVRLADGTPVSTMSIAGPTLRMAAATLPVLAKALADTANSLAVLWPHARAPRKEPSP
jgi:DNA-binding IclR family transcriptional regulator